MKSYTIHFIRHGEITENNLGKYIGITDVPLSKNGKTQLNGLCGKYEYPKVDYVYTSPLLRCIETCNIIYPDANVIVKDGLRECSFGEWENKTAKELEDNSLFKEWIKNGQDISPPKGESSREFTMRVINSFEEIVKEMMSTAKTNAAIVTHGGVIMALLSIFGMPKANFYNWITDNGCGYSARTTAALWMRDKIIEAYDIIPKGIEKVYNNNFDNIISEATNKAYGE